MGWDDALHMVADAAPLLGKLLPIPGAGIAGDLIASAFGTKNDKESIAKALAADPNAYQKLKEIEMNNKAALQSQLIQAETQRLATINATMQAEMKSDDKYVRRWRPTFGYLVGATWFLQVALTSIAIIYVAMKAPENTTAIYGGIAEISGSMVVMWSIALSVLGVSVKQRSNDKALASGQAPTGIVGKITGLLSK